MIMVNDFHHPYSITLYMLYYITCFLLIIEEGEEGVQFEFLMIRLAFSWSEKKKKKENAKGII